jgi:hypothetical protein
MIVHMRRIVPLLATVLLASCTGSSNDSGGIAVVESAHITPFPCNFDTPGYWCGGPSPRVTDEQAQDLGFDDYAELCACFQGASASPQKDNLSCPASCPAPAGGMADVLNKMWAAFQLSSLEQCEDTSGAPVVVEFVCPGAGCTNDGGTICDAEDVQTILDACDRSKQEILKDCIDAILNEGGSCTFPTDASCTPARTND